ncbi:MAG: transcriptional repressor [Clostridia bacterium]|nr:transcriptional repressor [Clostridia bacterium]MBR5745928.1 transcriptional repressor [Clostridia bacterium]
MAKYNTKQRRILMDYLAQNADSLLSAEKIAAALEPQGISLSAVYRNIAALESEGKVRRSGKAGSRTVYYQYSAAEECREKLHLSCRECGKTCHMEPREAERIARSVKTHEGFVLDRSETVLYGVCRECSTRKTGRKKEAAE